MYIFCLIHASKALWRSNSGAFWTFGYKYHSSIMKIGQTWLLKIASVCHEEKKKTHWPWPLCSQIQASQRCSKLSACQAKSHSLSLVGIRFSAFCIKMMMMMGSSNEQSTHALNSTGRMLWSAVRAENVVHHQAQKIIQSEKIRRPAPHWQIYFSI